MDTVTPTEAVGLGPDWFKTLVGWYIIEIKTDEHGCELVGRQGQIQGISDEYLLIDWFEWLLGQHTHSTLERPDFIEGWYLYSEADDKEYHYRESLQHRRCAFR